MPLAQTTDTTAWRTHRDPAGFSLFQPAAWSVRSAGPGDIVVSHPTGSAAAMVRTRIVPPGQTLAAWLQQGYPATEPGLHNVRMLQVEARDPRIASALFDYGSPVFEGRASLVAVRRGDLATLFVAAAARVDFSTRLPELTRVLDSVRFAATGDGMPRAQRLLEIGIDLPAR